MQSSLFIVLLLVSFGSAARVQPRIQKRFSSSWQSACRVLAKWICQEKTYKENLGQVGECCRASDVGDDKLREACCELEKNALGNATAAVSKKPVVKNAAEMSSESLDEDSGNTVEEIDQETILSPTLQEELADKWKDIDIEPDLEKKLVLAFHAEKPKNGLTWAMTCIEECVEPCESKGGECQAVQTEKDCQAAATGLGKTMIPIPSQLPKDRERYPKGCLVLQGKTQVRWNPPSFERPVVKTNNVCGCYK